MGRDQHRDALPCQTADPVPEVPPRLGINPGGRLVQQEKAGLVQRGGSQRQALFPATGEVGRQLPGPRREIVFLQCLINHFPRLGQGVQARHEAQVLAHGEIAIERETLGHIADPRLDLAALADDVEAERRTAAAIRLQQAAHHADGRGLARPVGAEKAVNPARRDRHVEIIDNAGAAKGLAQPGHVDGERFAHGRGSKKSGVPGGGGVSSKRASARKTRRAREESE